MDNAPIRAYLHDMNNALNAIKINTYLLRRLHGDMLDKQAIDSLDAAVADAERIAFKFQGEILANIPKKE